jgi:hypothetical protein
MLAAQVCLGRTAVAAVAAADMLARTALPDTTTRVYKTRVGTRLEVTPVPPPPAPRLSTSRRRIITVVVIIVVIATADTVARTDISLR